MDNLNFLLEKKSAEEFVNKYNKEITGEDSVIEISKIDRSHTFNPSSLNLLYVLDVSGKRKRVRLSSVDSIDKKINYEIEKYFYENGFDSGQVLVPQPLCFIKEYNLIMYADVAGQTFMHELDDDLENLKNKIKLAALAAKKIHSTNLPPFDVYQPGLDFQKGSFINFYPSLAEKIDEIKKIANDKLSTNGEKHLCHGDFQPNNIIFSEDKINIIDFGSVCIADQELDLVSFVCQLKIMLKKFGDYSKFEELKSGFLSSYGQYDLEKFHYYLVLMNLKLLEFFILHPDFENNSQYIDFLYVQTEESLKDIGIKV